MNPYRSGKLVLFQVTYDRDWHFFEIMFFVILGIFGVSPFTYPFFDHSPHLYTGRGSTVPSWSNSTFNGWPSGANT